MRSGLTRGILGMHLGLNCGILGMLNRVILGRRSGLIHATLVMRRMVLGIDRDLLLGQDYVLVPTLERNLEL
jgi:hypothetical protein